MISCPYWSRKRDRGQGKCALGFHRGAPWPGQCLVCMERGENQPPAPGKWPVFLLPIQLCAKPGDRGLGDVVARVIGPIGGNAFKNWFKLALGRSCGCEARQEALNARYPL